MPGVRTCQTSSSYIATCEHAQDTAMGHKLSFHHHQQHYIHHYRYHLTNHHRNKHHPYHHQTVLIVVSILCLKSFSHPWSSLTVPTVLTHSQSINVSTTWRLEDSNCHKLITLIMESFVSKYSPLYSCSFVTSSCSHLQPHYALLLNPLLLFLPHS